jgi:hypothetical protein
MSNENEDDGPIAPEITQPKIAPLDVLDNHVLEHAPSMPGKGEGS